MTFSLSSTSCLLKLSIKKLRRPLQRKRHIKIELCIRLSVLWLFHVGHVAQNRRSALSLAWYECFQAKAKNEKFTAASSRCRQNLKYENFTSSFGRLSQKIAPNSVPHVEHDFFSSFNQSNHWFVALSFSFPSSFYGACCTCRTILSRWPYRLFNFWHFRHHSHVNFL